MSFAYVSADKLLIDGQLTDAEGGATYDNINPATETSLGAAADASAGDVDRAIGAARRALDQTRWSIDVAFRVHCLRQLQLLGFRSRRWVEREVRSPRGTNRSR